jgi:hypothetical protein
VSCHDIVSLHTPIPVVARNTFSQRLHVTLPFIMHMLVYRGDTVVHSVVFTVVISCMGCKSCLGETLHFPMITASCSQS